MADSTFDGGAEGVSGRGERTSTCRVYGLNAGGSRRGARVCFILCPPREHGETIISYHCAMIATWPRGPHCAHVSLTESTDAVQLQQSVLLSASVWTILLCWPSYRGVSETYLILVGARTRARRAATG
jgi:hypothetical protein